MSDKLIIPHKHKITRSERNGLTGHKSPVIWMTGLSGSGKSTLAGELEQKLHEKGILTFIIDGDNIRSGLNSDLGFDNDDRKENIRRISEVAKLLSEAGVLTIAAFISPFRSERRTARELIGEDNFLEVYVKCDLSECEIRDVKGLYAKARNGEIKEFTGIDSPYEEPLKPDLTIDTSEMNLEDCVNMLKTFVESKILS